MLAILISIFGKFGNFFDFGFLDLYFSLGYQLDSSEKSEANLSSLVNTTTVPEVETIFSNYWIHWIFLVNVLFILILLYQAIASCCFVTSPIKSKDKIQNHRRIERIHKEVCRVYNLNTVQYPIRINSPRPIGRKVSFQMAPIILV